jgi:hypothetical protein
LTLHNKVPVKWSCAREARDLEEPGTTFSIDSHAPDMKTKKNPLALKLRVKSNFLRRLEETGPIY